MSYNWIGTDGFKVKSETERFTVVCPRCRQNLKLVISRSSFRKLKIYDEDVDENATKQRYH